MDLLLAGKRALISGSSSGIGAECAREKRDADQRDHALADCRRSEALGPGDSTQMLILQICWIGLADA